MERADETLASVPISGRMLGTISAISAAPGPISAISCPHCLLDVGSHGLNPGPVGRRTSLFVAPSPKNLGPKLLGEHCQLLGRAGLANARFPSKHDHASLASQSIVQGGFKPCHLLLAAHEKSANIARWMGLSHAFAIENRVNSGIGKPTWANITSKTGVCPRIRTRGLQITC